MNHISENNWSHLVSSLILATYAIMFGISIHAIAEAKRPASFLKNKTKQKQLIPVQV